MALSLACYRLVTSAALVAALTFIPCETSSEILHPRKRIPFTAIGPSPARFAAFINP